MCHENVAALTVTAPGPLGHAGSAATAVTACIVTAPVAAAQDHHEVTYLHAELAAVSEIARATDRPVRVRR
jgi:2-methylisocitrate lyase-like PEP mutase family enzyme